jgi:hypothetical protein
MSVRASLGPISRNVGSTFAHAAASSAIGLSSFNAPGNVATNACRQAALSRGPIPAFSWAAMAQTTADESNPPDKHVPIETSLRILNATAS